MRGRRGRRGHPGAGPRRGTFAAGSANAVLVSRSPDGGRTWDAPATLIRDGAGGFNDKETLTADPLDARFLYAAWDRLAPGAGGPAYFARTVDGGATWQPARAIFDPGPGSQTIGNLVRVLPNGTLVNLFVQLDGPEDASVTATIRAMRSTDRGDTWSAPVNVSPLQALGARDPTTGTRIRDGSIVAQMAAGPDGALHVVWQDARFTGARDAIAYSRSTDGGLTWGAPVRVNARADATAFTPQVHVRADGTVGVTYFDLRSDTADAATLWAEHWLARSTDGATWSEVRVAGPFDLATAPLSGTQYFLGRARPGLRARARAQLRRRARRAPAGGDGADAIMSEWLPPTTWSRSATCISPTGGGRSSAASTWTSRAARSSRSSAPAAPARPRCCS